MKTKDDSSESSENFNSYLKYSGIVFQLIGIILIGWWIGSWIDEKMGTPQPYWTAGIILFFILAFLFSVVYNLTKE